MASADPRNHRGPIRICAGTGVTYCPSIAGSRHVVVMCRSRLWLLYWVRTAILRMPPFTRFDRAKSISR